jgi:hypothetical protein
MQHTAAQVELQAQRECPPAGAPRRVPRVLFARLRHRPFVCASHVTHLAFFMIIPEMGRHSRYTTRLIGWCQSLCKTTFQGGSVRVLAPVRVLSALSTVDIPRRIGYRGRLDERG